MLGFLLGRCEKRPLSDRAHVGRKRPESAFGPTPKVTVSRAFNPERAPAAAVRSRVETHLCVRCVANRAKHLVATPVFEIAPVV